MHSTRWITGLIAAPLLIFLIVMENSWFFSIFVAVATVVALWEFHRIVTPISETADYRLFSAVGYATGVAMILVAATASLEMMAFTSFAGLIICGIVALPRFKSDPAVSDAITRQMFGILYIAWPLGMVVLLHGGESGRLWVLSVLVMIFAGDTAAYYSGSYLGKHKLCPSVSPKKTIEGALGGLVANLLVGILLKLFFFPDIGWGAMLLMSIVAGGVGQVGDLFESILKRRAGIKDSSGILPGHGGILDRIDALLFAIPVVWIFTLNVI